MTQREIRYVQQRLNAAGKNAGPVDGKLGPLTLAALNSVAELPANWSAGRKVIGYIQLEAERKNIEAGPLDGYLGPQTLYAFETLLEIEATNSEPVPWRPESFAHHNPYNWPSQQDERDLVRYYGEVGSNQTSITLPYPHRLSWNLSQTVTKFSCHEKVHDNIHRVLSRVLEHFGPDKIRDLRLDHWGGCLNVRQMRGGSRYSMHSWGIAVDYDPARNQLKWGRDKASFARPEFNKWWELWEEEGFVSLGRQRNFDWMHVQAARL